MNRNSFNRIKKVLLLVVVVPILCGGHAWAKDNENKYEKKAKDIKENLEKIRRHFELVTSLYFVSPETGEKLNDLSSFPDGRAAELPGGQSVWTYEMGVVFSGMVACAKVTGDEKYLDYTEKVYDFFTDNYKIEYSDYGLGVPRTGSKLSDKPDSPPLGKERNLWLYFQLDMTKIFPL